jgi:hypothetical protein
MSQRLPTSPVEVAPRRLSGSAAGGEPDQSLTLRQSLLLTLAAGFLGGYFVLYDQWLHLGWGVALSAAWFWVGGWKDFAEGLYRDRWLMAVLGSLAVLLVRSSVMESVGATVRDHWTGWGDGLLLAGFMLVLWQTARLPRASTVLRGTVVAAAALAAVVSLLMFYGLHPEGLFGSRLRNWFVYGGWNSVCTGLTFGFAAVWAIAGWCQAERRRWLWLSASLLLLIATLFTLSRGALLALVSGHGALLLAVGWRRAWRPLLLLVSVLLAFQFSAPLLAKLAAKDAGKRMGLADPTLAAQHVKHSAVDPNPMQAAVKRADSSRFLIYRSALAWMTEPRDWLLGKGLWAADDPWTNSLHWRPEHLHSIFMSALVHGGLPALLALLGLIGWGLARAVRLARAGESQWLMLAAFGIGGLIFDGDSAFGLLTVPRFEPLLLWTPLVIASARWSWLREPA